MAVRIIEQWVCDACNLFARDEKGPVNGKPSPNWLEIAIKDAGNPNQFDYKHLCPNCVKQMIAAIDAEGGE